MLEFDYLDMLNETMETLRTLFNIIDDYIFVVDESGTIIELNNAVQKLGYSIEELQGSNILLIYPPERYVEAFEAVKNMIEGKIFNKYIPLYSKDGRYISVETRVFRGRWLGKSVVFGICKSISNLKNQQRFLESMIDAIPDLVFFKDTSSAFLGCNNAFANKCMGLSKEEIIGKNEMELNKDRRLVELYEQRDNEVFETGETHIYEEIISMANGIIADVETVKTPFYDEEGRVAGLIGIARDITARKSVEKQLKVQTEYAEKLLNTVPSAVFSVDKNRRILSWNKWAERLTGYSEREAIGKDCSLFSDEPCTKECGLFSEETIQPVIGRVCTIRDKNGDTRYISKNATLLSDEMGEVTGGIECFDDITEKRHIEEQLRESEERYSAIVNSAPEIVVILKMGIIVFINDSGLKASGFTKSEIIGHGVQEFVSGKSYERILIAMNKRLQGELVGDFEIEFINKTGMVFDLIVKTSAITFENESAALAVLIDFTERKHAEEELNKKEKLLSAVAMSIKEFLECNDYLAAVGRSFELLGSATQVDSIYLFQNTFDSMGNGYTSKKVEWNSVMNKSQLNNSKWQDVPFSMIDGFIEPLIKGEAYFGIVRELEDDRTRKILEGQSILSAVVFPIFVRENFWGFVSFNDCRYERNWSEAEFSVLRAFVNSFEKAVERSIINEELEKSKRSAETANLLKGQFLANMSHEIRTPMNGIIGFVDLLFSTDLSRKQWEYLTQIKSASDALLLLINDILDYSKIEADKMELENIPFDIYFLVKESVNLFLPAANDKGIQFNLLISSDISRVLYGDPARIRQVLTNIVGNALKFTEKGEVNIKLILVEDNKYNVKLQLQVSDTGIGISQEVLPRLFSVFSQADASTTRKYGGTGLGLAISHRIIKLMNGEIRVESASGEGATFYILFELKKCNSQGNVNQDGLQLVKKELLGGAFDDSSYASWFCKDSIDRRPKDTKYLNNKSAFKKQYKILLVEDTLANQKLATIMLRQLGYNTELAENGIRAVELCKINSYDIILMDCQMPLMDGYEASSVIKKSEGLNKDTVIIAMTAHAMEGDREKCLNAGMDDYISKPIIMNNLDKMLKKWLKLPI